MKNAITVASITLVILDIIIFVALLTTVVSILIK